MLLHKLYLTSFALVGVFVAALPSCRAPDTTPPASEEVISLNDAEHPFPFFYTPGVPGLYGDSHGGYGYIGTSEAQADSLFRFSCKSKTLSFFWGVNMSDSDPSASLTHARVLQVLRDQVFEYWALRYAGTLKVSPDSKNPAEGFDLKPPTCVSPQSSGVQALQELSILPAPAVSGPKTPLSNAQIKNLSNGTSQRLMMKYRGTFNQLKSETLAYALAFSDMLEAQKQALCQNRDQEAACFDVKAMQERLHGDYESLFNLSEPHVNYIRTHLIQLIGASVTARELGWRPDQILGTAFTLPDSETYRRGRLIYDSWISGDNAQSILRLQAGIEQALKDGRVAAEKFKAGENTPLALKDELLLLRENAKNHWTHYHRDIPKKMQEICSLSYNDLIEKYPNAVRQALVDNDADPFLKQQMRESLCAQMSFRSIQPKQSCSGVKGERLPGLNPVVVSRSVPLFPFDSQNTFTIFKKSKSEPYHIYMKLEFEFDADFSEKERVELLTRWQTNAEAWYNCQSGGLTPSERTKLNQGKFVFPTHYFQEDELETHSQTGCNTDPELVQEVPEGIRFHFQFVDGESRMSTLVDHQSFTPARLKPQKVSVHHCYRTELSGSDRTDCEKIRKWVVSGCQKSCKQDGASAKSCMRDCEAETPHAGSARNNRADARHWIAAQRLSTVFHETGHLLGLYDDYTDFALPLNLIAEPDNAMRKHNNYPIRLHPRNFFTMLEPLRCANLKASTPSEPRHTLSTQKKNTRRRGHAGASRK